MAASACPVKSAKQTINLGRIGIAIGRLLHLLVYRVLDFHWNQFSSKGLLHQRLADWPNTADEHDQAKPSVKALVVFNVLCHVMLNDSKMMTALIAAMQQAANTSSWMPHAIGPAAMKPAY